MDNSSSQDVASRNNIQKLRRNLNATSSAQDGDTEPQSSQIVTSSRPNSPTPSSPRAPSIPATRPPRVPTTDAPIVVTSLSEKSSADAASYLGAKLKASTEIMTKAQNLCLKAEVGYLNVDFEDFAFISHGYYNKRELDDIAVAALDNSMDANGDQRLLNPVSLVADLSLLIHPPNPSHNPDTRQVLIVKEPKSDPSKNVIGNIVHGIAGQHRLSVGLRRYLRLKEALAELEQDEDTSQDLIQQARIELSRIRYWPARIFDKAMLPDVHDDPVITIAKQLLATNITLYHFSGHAFEQWTMALNWYLVIDSSISAEARMQLAKPQLNGNGASEYLLLYDYAREYMFTRLRFPAFNSTKTFRMDQTHKSFSNEPAGALAFLTLTHSLRQIESLLTIPPIPTPQNPNAEPIIVYTLLTDALLHEINDVYENVFTTYDPSSPEFENTCREYWHTLANRLSTFARDNKTGPDLSDLQKRAFASIIKVSTDMSNACLTEFTYHHAIPLYCPLFEAAVLEACTKTSRIFSYIGNLIDPEYTTVGPSSAAHWPHRIHDAAECLIRVILPMAVLSEPNQLLIYELWAWALKHADNVNTNLSTAIAKRLQPNSNSILPFLEWEARWYPKTPAVEPATKLKGKSKADVKGKGRAKGNANAKKGKRKATANDDDNDTDSKDEGHGGDKSTPPPVVISAERKGLMDAIFNLIEGIIVKKQVPTLAWDPSQFTSISPTNPTLVATHLLYIIQKVTKHRRLPSVDHRNRKREIRRIVKTCMDQHFERRFFHEHAIKFTAITQARDDLNNCVKRINGGRQVIRPMCYLDCLVAPPADKQLSNVPEPEEPVEEWTIIEKHLKSMGRSMKGILEYLENREEGISSEILLNYAHYIDELRTDVGTALISSASNSSLRKRLKSHTPKETYYLGREGDKIIQQDRLPAVNKGGLRSSQSVAAKRENAQNKPYPSQASLTQSRPKPKPKAIPPPVPASTSRSVATSSPSKDPDDGDADEDDGESDEGEDEGDDKTSTLSDPPSINTSQSKSRSATGKKKHQDVSDDDNEDDEIVQLLTPVKKGKARKDKSKDLVAEDVEIEVVNKKVKGKGKEKEKRTAEDVVMEDDTDNLADDDAMDEDSLEPSTSKRNPCDRSPPTPSSKTKASKRRRGNKDVQTVDVNEDEDVMPPSAQPRGPPSKNLRARHPTESPAKPPPPKSTKDNKKGGNVAKRGKK